MLKVEDVQAITDYCRVQGQSGRAAARVFQRSRNTISKVLKEGVEGFRRKRGTRRKPRVLLERHQIWIDGVLQGTEGGIQIGKQKHNGITITNHLRAHLDYEGSVSQVRRYIQRRRGELGLFKGDVTLDREKEPNGICEADWTQVKTFLAGALTTIWLFVMRFRFSGALFVRGYRAIDAESLRDGLQRGFEWFGGVARGVQMDNQKAAVAKVLRGRARKEIKDFAAFRAHYGFRSQYITVGASDENGAVEATMGPVARWITPVPSVERMADLNGYLQKCCTDYMYHQIRDRSGLVGENFEIEKNLLIPLPPRRYDTAREVQAGVNKHSRFEYRNVGYSVPVAYRCREVIAKGYAEEVVACCDGREIARHKRGFEENQLVLNPLHYLPVLRRKPNELDHAQAFRNWQLPLIYERFREELERRSDSGLREYAEVLSLLGQFSQKEVSGAMRRAAALETYSPQAVLFHLRLSEQDRTPGALETAGRWALPQTQLPRVELSKYEALTM